MAETICSHWPAWAISPIAIGRGRPYARARAGDDSDARAGHHARLHPPSTVITALVMKLASSDRINTGSIFPRR